MTLWQIALVSLVVVLLLAWLGLRQRDTPSKRASSGPREKVADRIDTVIGWPPQATRVLGGQERVALSTLVRALPEYMILAQVPLSRFLNVPKRNSYADWLRRVGYQSVDFLVCDIATQVIGVVELQAPQPGDRARKRLARIARTLKAAQIPLHVWPENALPSVDAAREALLPAAPAATTDTQAVAPRPATASAPASSGNPFDSNNRDSSQDETIELLEPPPSTWYDELDSDPVPLGKR